MLPSIKANERWIDLHTDILAKLETSNLMVLSAKKKNIVNTNVT